MPDLKTADHRRSLMDRHARVAVLIDRVASWTLCAMDEVSTDYHPVDDEEVWSKELVAELTWLNSLFEEAIANEGDVRRSLSPSS